MSDKRSSPRSVTTLPRAKEESSATPDTTTTAAEAQAQGLRFAAARLSKSRIGLIGSLTECREVLTLLKRHLVGTNNVLPGLPPGWRM